MPNPAVDVKVDDRNVIGYLVQPATEDQPWPPKAGDQVIVTPVKETGEVTLDISIDTSKFVEGISVAGRNLREALKSTRGKEKPLEHKSAFVKFADNLHREKSAAYGDSWKKRGEQMAIMANIARKVDRLGAGTTDDETSADTAVDLLIYLIKYRWWVKEQEGVELKPDLEVDRVHNSLEYLSRSTPMHVTDKEIPTRIDTVRELFLDLERLVVKMPVDTSGGRFERLELIHALEATVFPMARFLWEQEQAAKPEHPYVNDAATLTHRQETQRDVEAVKRVDEKTQKANATRPWAGYGEEN